jgi:AcrR family transcriptional regulator
LETVTNSDRTTTVSLGSSRRLDGALLDMLKSGSDVEVTIEAVAARAKVSRATAYRHFGDRAHLRAQAAITLIRWHAGLADVSMTNARTVSQRIQAGFAYTATAISQDSTLRFALTSVLTPAVDATILALGIEAHERCLELGQATGEIRNDIPVHELVQWIAGQQLVAIKCQLDAEAVLTWVDRFVLPPLREQARSNGDLSSYTNGLAEIARHVHESRRLAAVASELVHNALSG